ncbi:unnamed protein product, partial [Lymnaea stagnalis]
NITLEKIIQYTNKTFDISVVKMGNSSFILLRMSQLKVEDFRNYTLTINSTINVTITLKEEAGILLIGNQTERNISIQKDKDISFSFLVQSKDGIRQDIEINKLKVSINTTTNRYSINVRLLGEERYNFTIGILNFTLNSIAKYNVVVYSMSDCPIKYTVTIDFEGLSNSIELCDGEDQNK